MDPAVTARECVHSRIVDAPPAVVYRAFAEPERLARWWGPAGFRNTFESFELREGATWRFTMHGPDGRDYRNENVFRMIEPARGLVIEHMSAEHHFFLTITFVAYGERTLLGWRQVFDTAQQRESLAHIVGPANEQNLDRLEAEVDRMRMQLPG